MDIKHETSVRGQIEAMRIGERKAFPITRMAYIKNVMSLLNAVHYSLHHWTSRVVKESGVIEITKTN